MAIKKYLPYYITTNSYNTITYIYMQASAAKSHVFCRLIISIAARALKNTSAVIFAVKIIFQRILPYFYHIGRQAFRIEPFQLRASFRFRYVWRSVKMNNDEVNILLLYAFANSGVGRSRAQQPSFVSGLSLQYTNCRLFPPLNSYYYCPIRYIFMLSSSTQQSYCRRRSE